MMQPRYALLLILSGLLLAAQNQEKPQKIQDILSESKRVLWIGAHPDDENSSGALLARAKDVCGKLYMISMTSGENSHQLWGGLKRGAEIGKARKKLFTESAALFQADGHDVGPFVNGPHTLKDLDSADKDSKFKGWPRSSSSEDVIKKWRTNGDPIRYIVEKLRTWKPQVVISMDDWCGVTGNQEHIATAKLLLQAIPLAADSNRFPNTGKPWQVNHVIFSARINPGLAGNEEKVSEGKEPDEPIQNMETLIASNTHGQSYYWVACRVMVNYKNTMEEEDWAGKDMERMCDGAETRARKLQTDGSTDYPVTEPYRLRPLK
jgi:LmbE family N-acetylglucosaminyl deacetylase